MTSDDRVYMHHSRNAERYEAMALLVDDELAQRLLARAGVERKIAQNIALVHAQDNKR